MLAPQLRRVYRLRRRLLAGPKPRALYAQGPWRFIGCPNAARRRRRRRRRSRFHGCFVASPSSVALSVFPPPLTT